MNRQPVTYYYPPAGLGQGQQLPVATPNVTIFPTQTTGQSFLSSVVGGFGTAVGFVGGVALVGAIVNAMRRPRARSERL